MISTLSTSSAQTLERWEDKHVRLLITSYMSFKGELGKSQQSKKKIFEKVALEFACDSQIMFEEMEKVGGKTKRSRKQK